MTFRLKLHPAEAPRYAALYGPALPAVALAATVASVAVSTVGQLQAGQAARAEARYQSAVLKNNAVQAEYAARDAEARGRVEELKQRIATRRVIGRQRAVLAANGVVVDQDSALDITADTEMLGEFDALTIRDNAAREALALRQQRGQFLSEATLARMRGQQAQTAGYVGAGASFLGGLGSVAGKWYNYKQAGVIS